MIVDPTRTLPIVKYLIHTTPFKVIVFPGFVFAAIIAAATIFVERKFLAKMQLRVGPLYAGVWGVGEGILQLAADGLKVISKEILIPSGADKPIFWAAPIAFVATAAAVVALIPVAPGWVVSNTNVGLIAVFAILGFFPLIALLFSWASNSKYPFIGGLRALHQMIAFEIPFILSALSVVILAGSLNLTHIATSQHPFWFILFLPISAFVFFISSLAELERVPFDLPEAESEIVAGWLTETSGMIYGLIQLGSYLKVYALAALFVILFLGGWSGPGVGFLTAPGMAFGWQLFGNILGVIYFVTKVYLLCVLFIWIRSTLPRLRADQLMQFAWLMLIPATLGNILLTGLLYLAVSGLGLSNLAFLIVTGAINWLLLIGFIRLVGRATVATTRRAQAPAIRARARQAALAQIAGQTGASGVDR